MKYILRQIEKISVARVIIAGIFTMNSVSAFSEDTAARNIDKIQIQGQTSSGAVNYYFFSSTGWGAPGCPANKYAYLAETDGGAKAMLGAGLTAKASRTQVVFRGVCEGADYFKVNYMIVQ